MEHDADDLMHGYLDDRLAMEQLRALNDWLKQDPDHARRFALAVLLHDRLGDRFRAEGRLSIRGDAREPAVTASACWRYRPVLLATAAVGLVAALALFFTGSGRREALPRRLWPGSSKLRGGRVTALTGSWPSMAAAPCWTSGGRDDRGHVRPPIDGALLYVRGNHQYVLIRRPGEADEFVTGSDGREAWSIPAEGPVHVSPDPTRFRGAVPGEQQGLPFLDLGSSLGRLREAYVLELDAADSAVVRRLRAHKRSSAHRGPRDVSVSFDPRSGAIVRIQMDGMPQAHGGPRSVRLELIDEHDLGAGFFGHAAHHDPNRRVIHEFR